jgi:hypothetical protein
MAYPDAYVRNGEVCCIQTDTPLPSYSGLCLVDVNGAYCIMFTQPGVEYRSWDLVHWGSQLSSVEIEKYLKGKQ